VTLERRPAALEKSEVRAEAEDRRDDATSATISAIVAATA
jgi:hypothetical protein